MKLIIRQPRIPRRMPTLSVFICGEVGGTTISGAVINLKKLKDWRIKLRIKSWKHSFSVISIRCFNRKWKFKLLNIITINLKNNLKNFANFPRYFYALHLNSPDIWRILYSTRKCYTSCINLASKQFYFVRIRREFNETKANADPAGIYKQRAKKKIKMCAWNHKAGR